MIIQRNLNSVVLHAFASPFSVAIYISGKQLMEYSITELADEFDVSMRALRYYESEGLLFPKREMTRRIYGDLDRIRLGIIVALRKVNFKLDHIKDIFALFEEHEVQSSQLDAFSKLLEAQKQTLQTEADALALAIDDISAMAKRADIMDLADQASADRETIVDGAPFGSLTLLSALVATKKGE